ncbi:MAG: repressor LexA [Deltaproteobacteria bacterium]|jgi:SOS regulatory protein LexA|nr:repressor LexA [Deltaproteobacteria bacterium]
MQTKQIAEEKLDALRRFYRCNKRLPTYSEMCRVFGYSSKNAAFRLAKKLIDEGYVEKDETGRLTPRADRFGIPLVGYVQAGFPSPAEEELVDTLSLDEYLIDKPEASFLLKVSGDSMIDAGIFEGDLVIIERGARPNNGDVVLACVDQEWTLKHLHRRGKSYELVPANPKYPVIHPEGELTLGGVVKAVIRRY